jgi:TRAP-type C4-dicarboxylate transport system substrate-binding protein
MNEADARTTFASLPPEMKAQIQAKWDSLSDEQRIALKKMGPDAVKQLVASQMKEVMKQSMDPVVKPVQQVVEKAQSVAQKAKTIMQKGRDYVQGLIAKLKGQSSPPPEDSGSN